ncbi:MAG TPA: methyltransferase, partial [Burkholderiaceae bacterium]|nr:methyltransferase [Burkholderiaceae bacterium]
MDSTHPGPQHAGLLELINAGWTTQAIRTACVLRVPERLAGSASEAAAVAADLGCHAASLERLLRALASLGLCSADAQGRYALTASGELLRDDHPHSLRAWALLAGGVSWQRWAELDASVRSGLSHRQRHNGHDGFEDLGSSPSAAAGFHRAMVDITRPVAIAVARAIDARAARLVVDVGGSSGELLAHVLAAHPGPRGVLFDLPHGLEGASAVLER